MCVAEIMCTHACRSPCGPEENTESPGTGATDGYGPPGGCWETNPVPRALLTTVLQPWALVVSSRDRMPSKCSLRKAFACSRFEGCSHSLPGWLCGGTEAAHATLSGSGEMNAGSQPPFSLHLRPWSTGCAVFGVGLTRLNFSGNPHRGAHRCVSQVTPSPVGSSEDQPQF